MNGSQADPITTRRLILADREPTVRHALRSLAADGLGMQVVGEADSMAALQEQVRAKEPDLVVVAWSLIVDRAESLLHALRASSRDLSIIVIGRRPETRPVALGAGADGYFSMVDAPDIVARALRHSCDQDGSTDGRRLERTGGDTRELGGSS